MNRQARRDLERKENRPIPSPVMIPEYAVKDYLMKHNKNLMDTAILGTFDTVMRILALAINSEAGWGSVRIQRLIDRIMLQFECVTAGTLTGEDIVQFCKEKNINVEVNYEKA